MKPNGLQAEAIVSVNLVNANDNFPVFQKPKPKIETRNGMRDNRKSKNMGLIQRQQESTYDYEVTLYENTQPGTLVLKVQNKSKFISFPFDDYESGFGLLLSAKGII